MSHDWVQMKLPELSDLEAISLRNDDTLSIEICLIANAVILVEFILQGMLLDPMFRTLPLQIIS